MAAKKKEKETRMSASELITFIKKTHGSSIIQKASEMSALARVRTGVFSVDLGLGGGVPVGRTIIYYGPKSSCKTTFLLRTIGAFQKTCVFCLKRQPSCECEDFVPHRCAVVDAEGTLDLTWAPHHGVDIEELFVSTPEYGEQAVDIADALLRSGEIHLIAVDSLAFVVPSKEIEKSAGDAMMGDHAKLMNKAFRKWTSGQISVQHSHGFKPTLLCTNQTRSKIGLVFGDPEVCPGGSAPGFAASVEIRFQSGTKAETEGDIEIPVALPVSFKIVKNKTFGPKMSGEFTIYTQTTEDRKKGTISNETFLMEWAERVGTAIQQGKKWFVLDKVFSSKPEFENTLIKDDKFRIDLEDLVLHKALERGLALFQTTETKTTTEVAQSE